MLILIAIVASSVIALITNLVLIYFAANANKELVGAIHLLKDNLDRPKDWRLELNHGKNKINWVKDMVESYMGIR